MKLQNSFDIPLPPDRAWRLLLDIEQIAPCLPGTALTEKVDDRTYKGKVAVRLGPVALSFNGKATFTEIDEAGRRARVKAQGMDEKGRGGAQADVTFLLAPAGEGTRVSIDTDLNLSGSIAQYGRGIGIIQATSEQLVDEFANNLERRLSQGGRRLAGGDTGADEAGAAARPISGFTFMLRLFWRMISGVFRQAP